MLEVHVGVDPHPIPRSQDYDTSGTAPESPPRPPWQRCGRLVVDQTRLVSACNSVTTKMINTGRTQALLMALTAAYGEQA